MCNLKVEHKVFPGECSETYMAMWIYSNLVKWNKSLKRNKKTYKKTHKKLLSQDAKVLHLDLATFHMRPCPYYLGRWLGKFWYFLAESSATRLKKYDPTKLVFVRHMLREPVSRNQWRLAAVLEQLRVAYDWSRDVIHSISLLMFLHLQISTSCIHLKVMAPFKRTEILHFKVFAMKHLQECEWKINSLAGLQCTLDVFSCCSMLKFFLYNVKL